MELFHRHFSIVCTQTHIHKYMYVWASKLTHFCMIINYENNVQSSLRRAADLVCHLPVLSISINDISICVKCIQNCISRRIDVTMKNKHIYKWEDTMRLFALFILFVVDVVAVAVALLLFDSSVMRADGKFINQFCWPVVRRTSLSTLWRWGRLLYYYYANVKRFIVFISLFFFHEMKIFRFEFLNSWS